MGAQVGLALLVVGVVFTWFVPVAGVGVMLAGAVGMAIASEDEFIAREEALRLEAATCVPANVSPLDDVA